MHTFHRRLASPFADAVVCTKRVSLTREQEGQAHHSLDYQLILTRVEALCPPSLRDAMQRRPRRLQAGFALSRLAATEALQTLNPPRHDVFTGGRDVAVSDWSTQLSLSHEDSIAAALAWKPHLSVAAEGGQPQGRFAVDIGDVTRVLHLYTRFPQFRDRWLPQCRLDKCDVPSVDNARVLAQHWSIRECCVKLLGIPDRSFAYGCVQTVPTADHTSSETITSLPSGKLDDKVLYMAVLTGSEAAAFVEQGLHPSLRVLSWCESDTVETGDLTNRHYAVTVAWAPPLLRRTQ